MGTQVSILDQRKMKTARPAPIDPTEDRPECQEATDKMPPRTSPNPGTNKKLHPLPRRVSAVLATDSIIFVEDFQLNKTPKGPGRKFHISAPISASTSKVGSPTVPEEKSKISHLLTRRISFLTKADSKTSEEVVALNECLQLIYHRSYRHHLLLVYPREVLVLDLEIYQTVGIVTTTSPLQSVLTTSQRDSLLCLHENGSVSFRLRSHHPPAAENTKGLATEVTYDSHCQSDSFRLTKNSRVVGMSISPVQETTVALLVSDGRLVFQHLLPHKTEGSHVPYSVMPPCLGDLLPPYHHLAPGTIPRLRFLLSGVLGALAAAPHVLAMCPPVTYRNWRYHQPLLAIGTSQGNVQAINMAIGMIEKELSIHSAPVRSLPALCSGIEWVGLSAFISFSHPNLSASQGQVRNELAITDIHSGRSRSFRQDRSDESPIQMVRVSQLKQYFIIVFKEEPFELWDLANLTLLRTMPKTFPAITALTWYPLHSKKNQHHRGDSLDLGISDTPLPGISELTPLGMKTSVLNKEHFVVTDVEGQLYHFIIEGNVIHTGSFIPPEAGMGSITSLVWKTDQIVMGDADGNLNIWDIKERVSRQGHKIKFAPGRGNMRILVLFNDGVDLWDVKQVERISSLKTPTDLPKIQDIDWASSDRPVFSTVDGCIVMTDFSLKSFSSPLIEYHNTDPCYLPSTLSVKLAFHLKSSLQLQPNFTIDPPGLSTEDRKALELMALEPVVERQLSVCSLAERCLVVARLFGDEEAIHFWTVALHYLLAAVPKDKDPPEETYFACHAALPLDTCYDLLCDIPEYQIRPALSGSIECFATNITSAVTRDVRSLPLQY
ncbi:WDR11 [Cordylochernes scorpioides]|uniref:WDR11 n=1 Tax=Cordylochernes scorpioides TaxID=51811 RepID=A0ABY6LJP6_9ARAC|nr:WDR11 [Cordylochernes scorpioides]